ncbi:hypothetical protein KY346_04300 [Candidatus Woesearchaeota archaeon]|nr:hypothetical protein [Candidatus Woesearchaeota archaeon]
MTKKRAQVTIFIIIGIILLLSTVFVIYLLSRQVPKPIEEEIIVPEDVKPVHDFVTTCLQQTAKSGTGLLGQQGGFIDVPAVISRTYESSIWLDPKGSFVIPFWYFDGEDRTPSLEFMQKELERYVYENLKECVGDFENFKDQYGIVEKGNILPTVTIAEEDVVVRLKWPLELTAFGRVTSFEDYVARLPVKLKKAHEIASAVMKTENNESFFEKFTIDTLSIDPEIPTDDLRFECKIRQWSLDDITKRLQKVLYYNLPIVRVENTKYIPFVTQRKYYERLKDDREEMLEDLSEGKEIEPPEYTPPDAIEYFKYMVDAGIEPTDLRASFDYLPDWGMRLSAVPNSGGWLKSNMGRGEKTMLSFLCINQWHFTYDVIYPIRLTIKDDEAFAGEGYVFQMAFPVLVDDNLPGRKYFGVRRFEAVDFDRPFCEIKGDTVVDLRATGFTEASPIETELENVTMIFRCLTEECILGQTRADEGYYRLRTNTPKACINPIIVAEKEGYLPAEATLTGTQLTLPIKKLASLNVEIMVHPYNSYAKEWKAARELRKTEEALVHVGAHDLLFDQYLEVPSNNTILELIEGNEKYNIDVILNLMGNTIGGYDAKQMDISYADFADAETIVLHVFEYIPNPITDQAKIDMFNFMFAGNYTEALRPTFK